MHKDMRLSTDIIVRLYSYVVNIKVVKFIITGNLVFSF